MSGRLKFTTSKRGLNLIGVDIAQLYNKMAEYLKVRGINLYGLNIALVNSINKALENNKDTFIFKFSKIQFKIQLS